MVLQFDILIMSMMYTVQSIVNLFERHVIHSIVFQFDGIWYIINIMELR